MCYFVNNVLMLSNYLLFIYFQLQGSVRVKIEEKKESVKKNQKKRTSRTQQVESNGNQ